ncbi:MAG: cbb3-type cytochrome c oxidase subunit 3 [Proteobacteria bacterium]|nr:cbb3-type cytochrome c oxidase subunit 3 [Pseudomonadota bacterium]
MSLSESVARAGLAFYAEVALVIFFAVFAGILLYTLARRHSGRYERMRRLPLEDGNPHDPTLPLGEEP